MTAFRTLLELQWSRQQPQLRPLPSHVERKYVHTNYGDLELLVARPRSTQSSNTDAPIFFVHGGFGSAGVWLEWINYLYEHGYSGTLYAYSSRNHGASFALSYSEMVLRTTVDDLAGDLQACMQWAQSDCGGVDLVLVAHSSGGGLAQYALSRQLITSRALCLVDAVPHFGMLDMYWGWLIHDPWFPLRSLLHLGHPLSPLSTPDLVRGAFFGKRYDRADVQEFIRWMPKYESMRWPVAQFGDLLGWLTGRSSWLNVNSILAGIESSRSLTTAEPVCVLAGAEDMMLTDKVIQKVATEYREALSKLQSGESRGLWGHKSSAISGITGESRGGVRVVLVSEAGHHVQNDVQASIGAEALLQWARAVRPPT